jgi:hypothetical protein
MPRPPPFETNDIAGNGAGKTLKEIVMDTNTITSPNGTYPPVQNQINPNYPTYGRSNDTYQYGMGGAGLVAPADRYAVNPLAEADDARDTMLVQVRYWVGTGLTAVIAALTGLVALIVAQGILGIQVVMGSGSTISPISVSAYGLAAAGIAVLAAALFAGMIRVAPKPVAYYSWLVGMITVLAVLLPFTTTVGLHAQIALAVTNLAVGLVVMLGIPLAASNARP